MVKRMRLRMRMIKVSLGRYRKFGRGS